MVTPWKKMLSGNPLQPVSLLKIPKTFFIQEKSTKENLVHRKTTEVDFFQGKVKKIISSNKYSEKTLFKNWNIEKKEFLIFCKTLRTKYVDRKIMQQVCFENSPGNHFHGEKFRGNCFDSKNFMKTNLVDFKTIKLNFSMKVLEVCSTGIDSMKTAFINGETRTNTISLTGKPDGPISYKCNARKLVFLKKNPPISSIGNPRKVLSTTKKHWKSISSKKNPIHNLPWKNVRGKTSVDRFSL